MVIGQFITETLENYYKWLIFFCWNYLHSSFV